MASKSNNWDGIIDRTHSASSQLVRSVVFWRRKIWAPLVYSSAYLAVIAMVEVLIVEHLFALPLSPAPLVVALVTFSIYANDRLVDLDRDASSNPYRTAFVRRYQDLLYVLAAVAYGLAVALSTLGGPVAFGLTLLPGAAWVAYAVEWVPVTEAPVGRLKELLFVNSMVVAVAWSLAVVSLPLVFADVAIGPSAGVVFLYFTLATFVNTEIANVGDVESDRDAGVATMPLVFGVRYTRRALYGIVLFVVFVLGYAAANGVFGVRTAAVLSVGLAGLLGVVAAIGRTKNGTLLAVAAECTRLPVFALFFVLGVT